MYDPGQDQDSPLAAAAALFLRLPLQGIYPPDGQKQDKVSFRATISTVWVFLNTLILLDDIRAGLWNGPLVRLQLVSVPFLLAGMAIGGRLYARMSQRLFMVITYVLLFISGISLLVK